MAGLSSLSFSAPLLLAALALLPALWLLFRATPPPPRRERFAPFIILGKVENAEETPDKTPLLLLLIRSLIAAAVIIGLAGPALNAPAASGGRGPLLLVVDDTYNAAQTWTARLQELARAAGEAAKSSRPVFVLTTADPGRDGLRGPFAADEAKALLSVLEPQPFAADRETAATVLTSEAARRALRGSAEIRWLADGVAGPADRFLVEALRARGAASVYVDPDADRFLLRPLSQSASASAFVAERQSAGAPWNGRITAHARDGREIGSAPLAMAAGVKRVEASIDLPLSLRNRLAWTSIDSVRSAAAVSLADARDRRALIGLVGGRDTSSEALLSGAHYIRKALAPYAEFTTGTLDATVKSGASVIVLDDVGRLRPHDVEALTIWVKEGGVLIRFAGDTLSGSLDEGDASLLPVRLRGGRAVGGALSWETPQALGAYALDGPFAEFAAPDDASVRRQVLAEPGGEASERTWASLEDGTPLITGKAEGRGAIVLFHVTATPDWSDLPLTDTFVDMLRTLTLLAQRGPARAESVRAERLPPVRVLDGFGRLTAPEGGARGVTAADTREAARPGTPPGFYGSPDAPLALNAVASATRLAPLDVGGLETRPYQGAAPMSLAAPFLAAALILLAIDALFTLALAGRLRQVRAASVIFLAFGALAGAGFGQMPAAAQPLDVPIGAEAQAAALATRLAYVRTGDPSVDAVVERGLAGLSAELRRRTSLEPAPPAGVDIETDDLSVYPFLYWRVAQSASAPGEAALANIENFMRFGGLVVFDTADDERAAPGVTTPEQEALRTILSRLDTPPLTELPADHVLRRSFYILDDLHGRADRNPVWVQVLSRANDGVTPLIIGGRDWAGAWAAGDLGDALQPMRGGPRARELAYRAGINMAMVAFTGNYKSDQVHTSTLLRRLER